ncbi:hypothetical protein SFRURICE_006447 [Spodoptera frugiperda]|nr:hypothetical protein SFRURICE_006447 [Spodoptera frugiperda]
MVLLPLRYYATGSSQAKKYEIAHFSGVIGCIDCTHIKIRSPRGLSSEVYKNRKGFFSINVQVVARSAIKQRFDYGMVSSVLLTPFLPPNSNPLENYNRSHIKTGNTVERCFGVWKRIFTCLQVGMGMKVETFVAVIICACATLHNIALSVDDIMPMTCEDIHIQNDNIAFGENTNSNGFMVRQSLVDRFFQYYI